MIELDGNYLEGGGALLRTALAASALTGKPFRIHSIRSGRKKPGLKAQHLAAIVALKKMSAAKSSDVALGDTEMWFHPGTGFLKGGNYEIDIGTAGSITLALQALLLPCLFASSKVTLTVRGGTCGKWQASVDYLQELLLPQLRRFVKKIELRVVKRGYYPSGGGEILIEISPLFKRKNFTSTEEFLMAVSEKVEKIEIVEQGKLEQIKGVINLSEELEERGIGERVISSARSCLRENLGHERKEVPIQIRREVRKTDSLGGELLLWSIHSNGFGEVDQKNPVRLAGDALLEKGKESGAVGKEAALELLKRLKSGAGVDEQLADQLLCFMILLPGSVIDTNEYTAHSRTNVYVLEQFFPICFVEKDGKISVEKER